MLSPSPFIREQVRPRLFQTICLYCGSTLGYSPSATVIALMERVHSCPDIQRERQEDLADGS